MNADFKKTQWLITGAAFSALAGSPVLADDTELLLQNQSTASQNKPNIMFIIDTSGSMGTEETIKQPYDSTQTYGGSCDPDRLYWSDAGVEPDCTQGSLNRYVEKSSYVCAAANGPLIGIGRYSDTMIQRRNVFGLPFVKRWQALEAGNNTDLVECQADNGVHGDGSAGDFWPDGGFLSAFTNDSNQGIAWGSGIATIEYTVYDGNYLNWQETAPDVDLERIEIVQNVTNAVLNSVSNVNVGVMRFNQNAGGPVIQGVVDLDTNRTAITNTINSLDDGGATPLSETLYEAALYWRGLPAQYGENVSEHTTDPGALASMNPEVYQQPTTNACSKNFNVLLTDGSPVSDNDPPGLVPNLPGFTAATGQTACIGPGAGRGNQPADAGMCLDDIASYLYNGDIDTTLAGMQRVTTHTIGFAIDENNADLVRTADLLRATAAVSEGGYFLADDAESLATTLLNIFDDITGPSLSFAAPAVSVNAFNRTQNLNDLYLTVFAAQTRVHWPGNLKKYRLLNGEIVDDTDTPAVNPATGFFLNSSQSVWSTVVDGSDVVLGGAANRLPLPVSRNLYTNNGSSNSLVAANNALTPSNANAFTDADFGLTGATGEPTRADLIRWMRGEDLRDEDNNPSTSVRNAMGDPLHSQPSAVVYGGTAANPDLVVFTATNDGYLHAIDGDTGDELWSFVPKEMLDNMTRLYFDPQSQYKSYGIDGNIVSVVKDNDKDGIIEAGDNDFIYLIFGLRRGGDNYYALDVTNKTSPSLKWVASFPESGQSWSTPTVSRIDINDNGLNNDKAVVVIGGGYDPVHDTAAHPSSADAQGAGVHILDLESGARLWRAGPTGSGANLELPKMTRAIPTQIRVIDVTGDGFADRMYAADLGGQLWRFDIDGGQAPNSLISAGVLAQLGAEGQGTVTAANTRRFYSAPDVSVFTDTNLGRRYAAVSIGSGYRAHPLDNAASDRFYSVRDENVFNFMDQNAHNNAAIVTEADLVEVSGDVRVTINSSDRGWMFTLPSNQKVITESVTFDNSVFFIGFSPEVNTSDPCVPSQGRNFLYRVNVVNGDPVVNNLDTIDPADADAARVTSLQQGGIAPTPTFLFPSPPANCTGAACSPPPIGCVGVECFSPGFDNNPRRTLWTSDGIQ